MREFKVGDLIYYPAAKRNGRTLRPSEIPLLEVTEVNMSSGTLCAIVIDNRDSSETWTGKTIKNRPMVDYALHKAAKEEKKVNDLSDMDVDFTLSVLKNILNDKCVELATTFEEEGVESETFRRNMLQIKSLGESIEKLRK